jgi:hypothetical protein
VAEAEESQGIVDQQAPAVAAAEEAEEAMAEEQGPGEAAEEAGIVDQQAAAVDAMEDEDAADGGDDTVAGVTEAGAGGTVESELAADDGDDEERS